MLDCPVCKGSGKITLTAKVYGSPKEDKVKINCIHCKGAGKLTEKAHANLLELLDYEKNMWCKCEPISNNVSYVGNNTPGAKLNKHHYVCNVCNGVVQVG